ncbi:hypothetical protein Mapa_014518 [Marchantia paleacea]|nr:hypothetical protein Mapa_014518 [Marchantia paleacea]
MMLENGYAYSCCFVFFFWLLRLDNTMVQNLFFLMRDCGGLGFGCTYPDWISVIARISNH